MTTGIALAMGLDQIAHDNTVVSAGNDAGRAFPMFGHGLAGNAKPRLLTSYDPNIQISPIPRPELKSWSSRSNIITRMQSLRHPQPVNTAFQYKGHRVEIMGEPSAPTITVDGKDYTPFYKGSDLSPEMWIIGHIDAQAPLKTRGSS